MGTGFERAGPFLWYLAQVASFPNGGRGSEKWSRIFAQGDKWSFCLTAGKIQPANQEKP
jgi:hypothetical protein